MEIIAIANQKGGVGKTTSTINIGAGLRNNGSRVLLIDLDPQGSLTAGLGYEPMELKTTISDIFDRMLDRSYDIDTLLGSTVLAPGEDLHLLPADITLARIDSRLVTAPVSREYVLKRIINKIISTSRQGYDYILIDCAPSLSALVTNALTACTSVVVPIKAQYLDYKGFNQLYDNVQLIKEETNPDIRLDAVFLTMYDNRLKLAKQINEAVASLEDAGVHLCGTKISLATAAAEASLAGQDIFAYRPASKTAKEYAALVQELEEAYEFKQ